MIRAETAIDRNTPPPMRVLRRLLTIVTVLLAATPVVSAQAQAEAFASYDMKYVDGSRVLLLTFNTNTLTAGLDVEHNLRLYDLAGAPIPYDEVDVELHTRGDQQGIVTLKGESLIHEETLSMLATDDSKLSFAYPVRGPYLISLVFRADGEDIASGNFAVNVTEGTTGGGGFPWVRLVLTLLLGLFIGSLLPRGIDARGRELKPAEE